MAEIRKHRPRSSLIGDQVRAAIGADLPRPVMPGVVPQISPDPDPEATPVEDPFFYEDPSQAGHPSEIAPSPLISLISTDPSRQGVVTLGAAELEALTADRPKDDAEDE